MAKSTCPNCYKPAKSYGSSKPMPSGFTDQVVVCQCGWVGVRSEISSKPVQMTFPDFSKLVGKGVDNLLEK